LFLFNPAVWFSTSVWGQNHVVSLAFVLAAIWFAECNLVFLAWVFLMLGALTRPQMVVFAFLVGLTLLLRFPWLVSLRAVSASIVAVFILLLPFTLQTSPSLPIDVLVNTVSLQTASAGTADPASLSQDAYSIWPLVSFLQRGASGVARAFSPSSQPLFGSVSYQLAGELATILLVLAAAFVLVVRRETISRDGRYIPLITLGITAFLMFMTGVVATHFLLALPFLILCRRWMGTGSFLFIVMVWTVTTLVPMYGDMGNVIRYLDYPLLSPANNAVTQWFVALYSWDRFITFGTLANIYVLIWIGVVALRPHAAKLQSLA
jgi:hypothetical protein